MKGGKMKSFIVIGETIEGATLDEATDAFAEYCRNHGNSVYLVELTWWKKILLHVMGILAAEDELS